MNAYQLAIPRSNYVCLLYASLTLICTVIKLRAHGFLRSVPNAYMSSTELSGGTSAAG